MKTAFKVYRNSHRPAPTLLYSEAFLLFALSEILYHHDYSNPREMAVYLGERYPELAEEIINVRLFQFIHDHFITQSKSRFTMSFSQRAAYLTVAALPSKIQELSNLTEAQLLLMMMQAHRTGDELTLLMASYIYYQEGALSELSHLQALAFHHLLHGPDEAALAQALGAVHEECQTCPLAFFITDQKLLNVLKNLEISEVGDLRNVAIRTLTVVLHEKVAILVETLQELTRPTAEQVALAVNNIFDELSANEQAIIRQRHGWNGPKRSLEALAIPLKITRERVRQIQRQATEKGQTAVLAFNRLITYFFYNCNQGQAWCGAEKIYAALGVETGQKLLFLLNDNKNTQICYGAEYQLVYDKEATTQQAVVDMVLENCPAIIVEHDIDDPYVLRIIQAHYRRLKNKYLHRDKPNSYCLLHIIDSYFPQG